MEVSSSSMKVARVTVRAMTQGLMGFLAVVFLSKSVWFGMASVVDIYMLMKPFGLFLMLEVGKRTVWSQIFMGKVLEIARAKAPGLKPLFAFGLRGPKAEAIGVARGKGEMQR